ncbi:SpoIIE family protein phosphatase [Streptomyces sp. NPDC058467]|uniref:ATP-binding SpoIIE family protein phosphatase n=1 Tax=unclassified Streptomyces TaxID=2593676 RepID=UPI003649A177
MNKRTVEHENLRRDTALAATVREVIEKLRANTGLAYLLADDNRTLRAVIIGGAPPAIFTMPEQVDVDDPYASATAFRTGELAKAGFPAPNVSGLRLASHVPFPYSVVSVPICTERSSFGVLTFIWIPPSPSFLQQQEVTYLLRKARDLGNTLQGMADQNTSMRCSTKPSLLPIYHRKPLAPGPASFNWGLPDLAGSTEVSFMYQVHKLAAELGEAASVGDVITAAQSRIAAPFGATAILVSMLKEGRLWVVGHSGYSTVALRRLHGSAADSHHPDADALHKRTPLFFEDRSTLVQAYPTAVEDDLEASACLPIVLSGRPVGVCVLGFDRPRKFSPEERAVSMMMMHLLGPALERASLDESARSLAESLQKKLLPRILAEVPGMATTARYVPAPSTAGMGGDWYDMIPLDGGRIALVVGDVEGHNIESSVVMGQLRSAVRAYATEGHPPSTVLARANHLLTELDTDLLATCCFISFDMGSGVGEAALAGHPAPLIRTPDGSVSALEVPANLPLGTEANATYVGREVALMPGTLLMLYTDGLVQSRARDSTLTARSSLASAAGSSEASLERLADRLVDEAALHETHGDDVALLLARYEGPALGPRRHISRISFQRHDLHAVKAARQFVRDSLHTWGLDAMVDSLELMTSEIVTNALIHADSDVDLRLREYPDHLRLEVRDADPTPPVPASIMVSEEENEYAEHGRGLIIVESLTSDWGNSPSGRGKTVWIDVETSPDSSACRSPR